MALKKPVVVAVCVVVLAGSLATILRGCLRTGPRYDRTLDECLGAKLAEETVKLAGDHGAVLVVNGRAGNPQSDARWRGFRQVLEAHPGLKILGTETPAAEPEVPRFDGLPAPFLERILSQHPDTTVLVSFLGPPDVRGQAGSFPADKLPAAVVALSLGRLEHWQDLLGIPRAVAVIRDRTQSTRATSLPSGRCEDYVAATSGGNP